MKLLVETTIGTIEGFEADGIRKFLGFPYAMVPFGERRFHETAIPEKQEEIIRADGYRAKCPQLSIPMSPDNGIPQSEDCLYMNIWAPAECKKAPVFFWTTGGAFAAGEGSDHTYDGTNLVTRGDVIVVTYNYRVGVFGGFYPLDRYVGKEKYTPNTGLSDVMLALKFVHDNIESWGGDPDNITIAGESAGAVITAFLAGTPELQGMFSKVVLESFADMEKFGIPNRDAAEELVNAAGVSDVAEILEWDTDRLMELQAKISGGLPTMAGCKFVNSGAAFEESVWDRIGKNMKGKAVLAGTNKDEAAVLIPPELAGKPEGNTMKTGMTKAVFEDPTENILKAASAGNRAFAYRFDYVPFTFRQNGLGAFHSAEMNYVFGNLMLFPEDDKEEAQEIADNMMEAWISFMKTGEPGWETYTMEKPKTHHFDRIV